jgi:hypothetical protein
MLIYRTWVFFTTHLRLHDGSHWLYIFRALSSCDDPYDIIYFVVAYFFIAIAPVFISASIYVCLTKLISWAEDGGVPLHSRIPGRKFILWTFITADTVCTVVQIAGAGFIGSRESKDEDPKAANDILLAGLAIQSFFFLVYLWDSPYVHACDLQRPTTFNNIPKDRRVYWRFGSVQLARISQNSVQACRNQSRRIWILKLTRSVIRGIGICADGSRYGHFGDLASWEEHTRTTDRL